MARVSSCVKLLNEDGSFRRWVYPREVADLLKAERVHRVGSGKKFSLRLKALPSDSDSDASPLMPTLTDMCIYAERRRVPDEIRAKVESCAPNFQVRYMDLSAAAA